MRWTLLTFIQEFARRAGHGDILGEIIDRPPSSFGAPSGEGVAQDGKGRAAAALFCSNSFCAMSPPKECPITTGLITNCSRTWAKYSVR